MRPLNGLALGLTIREAKRSSLKGVAPVKSSVVQLFPGGSFIDPVAELAALTVVDPQPPSAPLFRNGDRPIRVSEMRRAVKECARVAGLDAAMFGAHSVR